MKIRRKGVGQFDITIIGKESHSGINPQDGINAIHEAAWVIKNIAELNDFSKGTTVNVNLVQGGTARNVIPGKVTAEVDFRAETITEAKRVESAVNSLVATIPGAELEIKGGMDRPPMEDSPESNAMADLAREIGLEVGLDLDRKLTGGGSDGNFTAAIGIPTLDGLGLDGGGAHTPDEHVLLETIPARSALLAELILQL
jgi:glutamate carboxypeptidase